MRYQDETFDSLLSKALREIDDAKRYELYRQADQKASDDAAIMPIFYDENTRLIQVYVKNFPSNAMEHRDMSRVYFDHEEL
jgi:ABC-type transport system substrate-binding protein